MSVDPSTTKYLIKATITAEGIVEKPDVVGAIFGQTEGLLGEGLDLRDLQKSGRIGRIEVEVNSEKGKSRGEINIPCSLDQVETSILASSLETIDRVGPCKAKIGVAKIEDVRVSKRKRIVERAKELLGKMIEESKTTGIDLTESVRETLQMEEITSYGADRCPAGPNVKTADAIIVVEGRADVLNLLRCGIKNTIAVNGTSIPKTIQDLSKEKVITAFVDGDRGGELILKELLQVAEVDFIARAPRGQEVEELTHKQITKGLRNKIPGEQFVEMYSISFGRGKKEEVKKPKVKEEKEIKQIEKQEKRTTLELAPQLKKFKETLSELSGTSKAKLFNNDNVIEEVKVRDLANTLKKRRKGVKTVVFDGVVTQRLLDIASSVGIKTIVGTKLSDITKRPIAIDVWTKKDLE